MSSPDFTFVQGDAGPSITDTLTFADGTPAPLAGATVTFQMRSLTSSTPLTLTGSTTVTSLATGGVQFTPTVADTSQPAGAYQAVWNVVYSSGQQQTFPTVGYLWGVIQPNLTSEPQALVSLPEVKDYINANGGNADRGHDNKLLGFIQAATPLIENVVGPVIVRTFDEWHQGGQFFIQLRRRPSFALGTTPVLNIVGCDEYRGPVKYSLAVVPEPTQASIYSVMLDQRIGTLYRRTTGGGVIPFGAGPFGGAMPQAVHVVYQAGQQTVPWNVRQAALEAVRWNYEASQPTGLASRSQLDTLDLSPGPRPFAMPPSAMQYLTPMRRHPAVA